MSNNWTLILLSIILVTLFSTFFYSILSRRAKGAQRGLYRAWMNLSMGMLFLALSVHLYSLQLPTLGKILTTLILIIGGINLYYGWKYRQFFSQQESSSS